MGLLKPLLNLTYFLFLNSGFSDRQETTRISILIQVGILFCFGGVHVPPGIILMMVEYLSIDNIIYLIQKPDIVTRTNYPSFFSY